MDQGQKITYHRLGIFLILALLTLACSLSVPGNTKEASPVGIPPVTDTASTAPETNPTPLESSGQQPQGPAVPVPTRDQIVKSFYANGFIDGDNDKHFKNVPLNLIAFIENGCDVSILINVDANISRDDQFQAVLNILADLYPKDFVKYFNSYKIEIYDNAVSGGMALSVKGQKSDGFMMTIGNPLYTPGVLVALFHPGGAYSNIIN
jgi:hypothetical protein